MCNLFTSILLFHVCPHLSLLPFAVLSLCRQFIVCHFLFPDAGYLPESLALMAVFSSSRTPVSTVRLESRRSNNTLTLTRPGFLLQFIGHEKYSAAFLERLLTGCFLTLKKRTTCDVRHVNVYGKESMCNLDSVCGVPVKFVTAPRKRSLAIQFGLDTWMHCQCGGFSDVCFVTLGDYGMTALSVVCDSPSCIYCNIS